MRADELVDQLHEGSARYAGRSAAAAGRLRASVLAEFAEVGLPAAAVPYVVEVLRTELNPEVVAAAAVAVRGWPGSDPELASALVQAVVNLRGRDGPAGPGTSRTALVEVLSALAWQPSVPPRWWPRWSGWAGRTARTGARRFVGRWPTPWRPCGGGLDWARWPCRPRLALLVRTGGRGR